MGERKSIEELKLETRDSAISFFEDYRAPRFLTIFVAAQQCVWR